MFVVYVERVIPVSVQCCGSSALGEIDDLPLHFIWAHYRLITNHLTKEQRILLLLHVVPKNNTKTLLHIVTTKILKLFRHHKVTKGLLDRCCHLFIQRKSWWKTFSLLFFLFPKAVLLCIVRMVCITYFSIFFVNIFIICYCKLISRRYYITKLHNL